MNKLVGYRNKQCDNECDKSSGGIRTAKNNFGHSQNIRLIALQNSRKERFNENDTSNNSFDSFKVAKIIC